MLQSVELERVGQNLATEQLAGSKDLKGLLGPEMSRTWGCLVLRLITRQRGLLQRAFFLPKAAYNITNRTS